MHLSKLFTPDSRSMQSLKNPPAYQTNQLHHLSMVRLSPLVNNQQTDENWLSCEELENIERRFTDLLQNTTEKKSSDYQHLDQRAKSCDRLTIDEPSYKPTMLTSK